MPKRLKPTKYVVNGDCSSKCSLNVVNLGEKTADIVHGWFEGGLNDFKIEDNLREMDITRSHGSIGRHRRNHLTEASQIDEDEGLSDLDDIEALDMIIKRGQTQIPKWKLTPSEYFKAMEMKYRLTQGSTMDAMYAAMAAAGSDGDEDEDAPETESGQESVEETGERTKKQKRVKNGFTLLPLFSWQTPVHTHSISAVQFCLEPI